MSSEPAWRLGAFAAVLVIMMAAEAIAPRRRRLRPRSGRWAANLSLTAAGALIVRLVVPTGLTGFAMYVEQQGWGVLAFDPAQARPMMGLAAGVIAFVILDLVIYAQHVMFHYVPWLWRLHRVHHTDAEIDATTGVRFHPVEILLSLGLKAAAVALLGAPPLAVLVFEIVLNGSSMFNHANWRMPLGLDAVTRLFVVTPDMHRVHHSVHLEEQNANFGFNFAWWDRLFGTYQPQPAAGHDAMAIGVANLPDPRSLVRLLLLPFR